MIEFIYNFLVYLCIVLTDGCDTYEFILGNVRGFDHMDGADLVKRWFQIEAKTQPEDSIALSKVLKGTWLSPVAFSCA